MRYLIGFICILFIPLSASADALDQAFKDFTTGHYEAALPVLEAAAEQNPEAAFAAGIIKLQQIKKLLHDGKDAASTLSEAYEAFKKSKTAGYPSADAAILELKTVELEALQGDSPRADKLSSDVWATLGEKYGSLGYIKLESPYQALLYFTLPKFYKPQKLNNNDATSAADQAVVLSKGQLADWFKAEAIGQWARHQLQRAAESDQEFVRKFYRERAFFALDMAYSLSGRQEFADQKAVLTEGGWSPFVVDDETNSDILPLPSYDGPDQKGFLAFDAGHFFVARQLLQPLADAGNPDAAFAMYYMMEHGLAGFANPDQGMRQEQVEKLQNYLMDAVEGGSGEAATALSVYFSGVSDRLYKKNDAESDQKAAFYANESRKYLNKALNAGIPYAYRENMGVDYRVDPEKTEISIRWGIYHAPSKFMRWDRSQSFRYLGDRAATDMTIHAKSEEFGRIFYKFANSLYLRASAIAVDCGANARLSQFYSAKEAQMETAQMEAFLLVKGATTGARLCTELSAEKLLNLVALGRDDLMTDALVWSGFVAEELGTKFPQAAQYRKRLPENRLADVDEKLEKVAGQWKNGDMSFLDNLLEQLKE